MVTELRLAPIGKEGELFSAVLPELKKLRDEVEETKNWYRVHAWRPMLWFRIIGVLLIALSVSIPFLATLQGFWKEQALPLFSLAIAGLTGINSFFQFQSQWHGYRQTQFSLEYLLTRWEMELIEAKYHPDHQKAVEIAVKATAKLLDRSREVTASETGDFFKAIQLPSIKTSG